MANQEHAFPMKGFSRRRCFGFPELDDSGLGNMLVPWAKCLIWCRDHRVEMIAPHWGRPGAARDYRGCFADDGYVTGPRRRVLLALGSRRSEGESRVRARRLLLIRTFRGLEHVEPVLGRHQEVADELWRITRPDLRPDPPAAAFIALHVRRGDFATASEEALRAGTANLRQPIRWYVEALHALRQATRSDAPAILFSDGADDELAPLLSIGGVGRSPYRAAVTDILLLSRAAAIIASRSTFSAWASFLGQAPALYFPGARPCPLSLIDGPTPFAHEPEWEYGQAMPSAFCGAVQDRLLGGARIVVPE